MEAGTMNAGRAPRRWLRKASCIPDRSESFRAGTTNAVSGAVSEEYFRAVLRWENIENIWRASVAQGILVGLGFGVFFSVVFSLVVGLTAKGRCTYAYALRHMLGVFIGVYCCWVIGGVIATGIAALSPEFFRATFPGDGD